MKFLRPGTRINPRDSFGQGLDAVITVIIFFGIGFMLDRWLGTAPWLMIVTTVLGAIGVFYRLKAAYEAQVERERVKAGGR